jgi:hypothetical protein
MSGRQGRGKRQRDGRARIDLQEQLPATDRSRLLDRHGGIKRKSRNLVSCQAEQGSAVVGESYPL